MTNRDLIPHTRVHALLWMDRPGLEVFLKREDETGHVLVGGKKRKLASLLPYLKSEGYTHVAAAGSLHGNNIPALCSILLENDIQPVLFLKATHTPSSPGNFLLTKMLVAEENIRLIEGPDWEKVNEMMDEYCREMEKQGEKCFPVPEGNWCRQALEGCLTLAEDVLENENQTGHSFDHILIDAGTGLSAAGLILGMYNNDHSVNIHILSLAEDKEGMEQRLNTAFHWYEQSSNATIQKEKIRYRIHLPEKLRSFGTINNQLMEFMVRLAREHGILTDPVYSGKLLFEAENIISNEKPEGKLLIIHSGGTSSLPGFAEKLLKLT